MLKSFLQKAQLQYFKSPFTYIHILRARVDFCPMIPSSEMQLITNCLKGKDTLSFSCISAAFKGRDTSSSSCISAATVPYSVGHNWAKCASHQIGGGHLLLYCSSRNGQQTITSGSTNGQNKLHITYAFG